jgi:hypothetical protein
MMSNLIIAMALKMQNSNITETESPGLRNFENPSDESYRSGPQND